MDFSTATAWWALAGLVVAAELLTGTFYLLMVALGLCAAAVGNHVGLSFSAQLITAALVGGGATALWHWRRARQPRSAPANMNRDVNLDIGERVKVTAWGEDRTARVHYRGTQWTARLAADAPDNLSEYVVTAMDGNTLVVSAAAPSKPVPA